MANFEKSRKMAKGDRQACNKKIQGKQTSIFQNMSNDNSICKEKRLITGTHH